MSSSTTDDDARRVAAVERLRTLGPAAERRLDRICRLATEALGTPIALVSLLDTDHQWVRGRVGLDVTSAPREHAFCDRTMRQPDGRMVIEDTAADPRFADNPHVTGAPYIQFYAGQVLHDAEGYAVGTVCLIDQEPRTFSEHDREVLADLTALAEEELARAEDGAALLRIDESERTKALILETISEGLVLLDAEGAIVQWNPAAERLLGIRAEEILGHGWLDPRFVAIRPDGTPWPDAERPAAIARRTGRPVVDEMMGMRRDDGSVVWLRVNAHPTHAPGGELSGLVVSFADLTAQHQLYLALQTAEEVSTASLDALEEGVMLIEDEGTVRRINPAALRILGHDEDEIARMFAEHRWTTYDEQGRPIPVQDRPSTRARRTGETVRGETVGWRRPDGELILLRMSCIPTDGRGLVVAFAEVTAEHRMLRDLTRFSYLFENANDMITVIDGQGHAMYSSPSIERVLGYPNGWHHSGGVLAMVHPEDAATAAEELAMLIAGRRGPEPFLVRVQAHSGEWRHIECVGVNLLDEPLVEGVVLTCRDATERVRMSEELAHRATHDALTGLPNRRLLEDHLHAAMARVARDGTRVGICFVDLDGFKGVNDTLGHAVGDRLLVDTASHIREVIREGDMVARFGGDEFVVVLDPVTSEQDALGVATRLRDSVLRARPMGTTDTGEQVRFGVSVGLAVSELGDTPTALLRRADEALYGAKATRDSSVVLAGDGVGAER